MNTVSEKTGKKNLYYPGINKLCTFHARRLRFGKYCCTVEWVEVFENQKSKKYTSISVRSQWIYNIS